MGANEDVERLRHHVAEAMSGMGDPNALLPLLHRLVRNSREGSEENIFAHEKLAEILVERSPWRAALHAKRVLDQRPADDRAWALTALCHTVLGHYRYAVSAYRKALHVSPENPWYAHNLGHLLDIALNRPTEALKYLRKAFEETGENAELAASYAHALARAGERVAARQIIVAAQRTHSSKELGTLLAWIDGSKETGPLETTVAARSIALQDAPSSANGEARPKARARGTVRLQRALERGLRSLPFDERQRERAREIATDIALFPPPHPTERAAVATDCQSLAAAIAYAIVYVDHVPLSETEVAATFRVTASALRGRFREVRSRLRLTPGDARYATTEEG